jgi:hypothetical protein
MAAAQSARGGSSATKKNLGKDKILSDAQRKKIYGSASKKRGK